jgi:hypothetical protein
VKGVEHVNAMVSAAMSVDQIGRIGIMPGFKDAYEAYAGVGPRP